MSEIEQSYYGGHLILHGNVKTPRMWWTTVGNPDVWYEDTPGVCGCMWFPKAEWLLENYPWLAVRLFWLGIAFNEGLDVYWGRETDR